LGTARRDFREDDNAAKKEILRDGCNPIDDMMKLERELRDIDMTLSVNPSLDASLSSLAPNPNRKMDGSFYILPNTQPSSSSYLSSSLWMNQKSKQRTKTGQANNMPPELESSWWGSTLNTKHTPSNLRQLDSIKTLTDENAILIREIENAALAKKEALEVNNNMQKFKIEYSKKFQSLKLALEKFRKEHPGESPVEKSDHFQSLESQKREMTLESQKREIIIRKLAADLRKERESIKKKDAALKKYEGFYREVKKRSEQKQRQKDFEEKKIGCGGLKKYH